MNIESNQVTMLNLTDLHRLDPVKVITNDIEEGKGSIIITCYGKAWTAYWGGMSKRKVSQFFIDANTDYLAENLAPQINSETQWNPIEDECGYDDFKPEKNHEYIYICRIIDAVKSALQTVQVRETKKNTPIFRDENEQGCYIVGYGDEYV